MDVLEDLIKHQLDQIGRSIGYGRAIQILGQMWDDMLQATYPDVGRYQEGMNRNTDIERIEAGMPIGRKVVYHLKRGPYAGQIAKTFADFGKEVPNAGHIISDTPLYGRVPYEDNKPSEAD